MEIYEKIYKVIELYNKYKGNLNDDGTVATYEQIAEWIVPSVEDCKEKISEEELDKLAEEYALQELGKKHYPEFGEIKRDFKAGFIKSEEVFLEKACEWMMNFKFRDEFPLYDYVGNFRKAMENGDNN